MLKKAPAIVNGLAHFRFHGCARFHDELNNIDTLNLK
jgi:hypothetical protein